MITQGKWEWKQNRDNNEYEHSVFVRESGCNKVIAELTGGTMAGCKKEEVKDNARLIAAAPETKRQRDALQEFARNFFEWHANHFEDFSTEINAQLLSLANTAEPLIAQAVPMYFNL